MSCTNRCVLNPGGREGSTSTLFKVLLSLKSLHGTRDGEDGASFEDIAVYMVKYFCLDGDIKSQVLASLKYGVKQNLIMQKNSKFSLVQPASSVHLAPCECRRKEMERTQKVYPVEWRGAVCNTTCGGDDDESCCGKKRQDGPVSCDMEEEQQGNHTCEACAQARKQPASCPSLRPARRASSPCPRPAHRGSRPKMKKQSYDECPRERIKRRAPCSTSEPSCPKRNRCAKRPKTGSSMLKNHYQCPKNNKDSDRNQHEATRNCSCCGNK